MCAYAINKKKIYKDCFLNKPVKNLPWLLVCESPITLTSWKCKISSSPNYQNQIFSCHLRATIPLTCRTIMSEGLQSRRANSFTKWVKHNWAPKQQRWLLGCSRGQSQDCAWCTTRSQMTEIVKGIVVFYYFNGSPSKFLSASRCRSHNSWVKAINIGVIIPEN